MPPKTGTQTKKRQTPEQRIATIGSDIEDFRPLTKDVPRKDVRGATVVNAVAIPLRGKDKGKKVLVPIQKFHLREDVLAGFLGMMNTGHLTVYVQQKDDCAIIDRFLKQWKDGFGLGEEGNTDLSVGGIFRINDVERKLISLNPAADFDDESWSIFSSPQPELEPSLRPYVVILFYAVCLIRKSPDEIYYDSHIPKRSTAKMNPEDLKKLKLDRDDILRAVMVLKSARFKAREKAAGKRVQTDRAVVPFYHNPAATGPAAAHGNDVDGDDAVVPSDIGLGTVGERAKPKSQIEVALLQLEQSKRIANALQQIVNLKRSKIGLQPLYRDEGDVDMEDMDDEVPDELMDEFEGFEED